MPVSPTTEDPVDIRLAITAEALYLINLLLAPGLGFLALLWLYWKRHDVADPVGRCHLEQTVSASLWGGFLLVVINAAIILLGGYDGAWTWLIVIIYFTMVHSTFIILGMIGLIKAMAGQCWKYPLVGRPTSERA
jgi:uncharacterized Tic20 family protein